MYDTANDYDAIVIGSRCAGAPTAMLLARRGRRVLLVDRATFPSDVLSGHTIQPAGMASLARWGLLDRVKSAGAPFVSNIRFDFGPVVLEGEPAPVDGISDAVCIRRTVIDPLLTDAAAEAGADVRLGVTVTELLRDGSGRVAGVAAHDGQGNTFEVRAPIVIGADGVNSFVARTVSAPTYEVRPSDTIYVYSYWQGLGLDHFELYSRPGRFFVATPTNDDLAIVVQQVPAAEADRYRHRVSDAYYETVAEVPRLAELLAGGQRVERFRFGRGQDGFLRQPFGPGWALVGDAGYHKDPITAQGMSDAFRDAERLAEAVDTGLAGDLTTELQGYQQDRDAAVMPMYGFTSDLAELAPPPPEVQQLIGAIADRPEHIARFLGIIAGSVSVPDFFAPQSIEAMLAPPKAA